MIEKSTLGGAIPVTGVRERGEDDRLDRALDAVLVVFSAVFSSVIEPSWRREVEEYGVKIFSNMSPITWKLGSTMKSMKPI